MFEPIGYWVYSVGYSKDGIYLLELLRGISSRLVIILQFDILVQNYHYVEKDSQANKHPCDMS
jgi:hypothetical protein